MEAGGVEPRFTSFMWAARLAQTVESKLDVNLFVSVLISGFWLTPGGARREDLELRPSTHQLMTVKKQLSCRHRLTTP